MANQLSHTQRIMFLNSISKKRKSEIKYQIKGLVDDVSLHRNNYHKVCDNNEFILKSILNQNGIDVDGIGNDEFNDYMDALKRIKGRIERTEKRFANENEEQYYDKRLRKLLANELNESTYLLNKYNTIKDVFPFLDESELLFDIVVREIRRQKKITELIDSIIKK
jgi:hypothetical protein